MDDPRVIKAKLPWSAILSAIAIGGLLLAFIIYAVWSSGIEISDAKKSGIIVKKEFKPAPEEQLVLQRSGGITAIHKDGEYILTVDVSQKDGTKKAYLVLLGTKEAYDAVKVGDRYDVGPYLAPEVKEK